ncbi:MAG TPA: YceD family protein [Gammaproteobacteria bacterium]|nr:YceD family protein [Gammaproteobacteria bacterium]
MQHAHTIARMSEKLLPEQVDPFRYAEQGLRLDGQVRLADMPRLGTSLYVVAGSVKVAMQFGRDEQDVAFMQGQLKTMLSLQCQRCLEPYDYEIIADFTLGIVKTIAEANALPERYEPVLVKEGMLALREVVEDELILNLPIIPMHAADACKVKLPLSDADWETSKRETPFQVLAALKEKGKAER